MPRCKIKICAVTREEDVSLVSNSGADYIGLLIDMPSKRTLTPNRAAELMRLSAIPVILLFYDKGREEVAGITSSLMPAGIQLQGHETTEDIAWLRARVGCEIWKGVHLPAEGTGEVDITAVLERIFGLSQAGATFALLDTIAKQKEGPARMGGTGISFDWASAASIVAQSALPIMLAGGLKPENVARAIEMTKPFGVDLASGVEVSPGIKDPEKVRKFVEQVEAASTKCL